MISEIHHVPDIENKIYDSYTLHKLIRLARLLKIGLGGIENLVESFCCHGGRRKGLNNSTVKGNILKACTY